MSEDEIQLIGCVNPALYINVLEEEVPIIMKEEKLKVKVNKGFADNSNHLKPRKKVETKRRLSKNEYEEFNIYKEQFNSQIEKKVPQTKKMRPSKSQNAFLLNPVPFEVVLEEERKKRRSALDMGFEDEFEIDPFGDNTFVVVADYNTLKKNKDKEYVDEPQSKFTKINLI